VLTGLHEVAIDEIHRLVLNLAILTHDLLKLTPPTGEPSASYNQEHLVEIERFISEAGTRSNT
jgi:hypothetical protein